MAKRPVANALILELEPVVDANLARHIDTVDPWYAHDYVPFEQGENFAFLGGKDWDPSQVTLPKVITDACEILLIEKDSLAGYHRELVEHFILEDKWGRWIGRWTAEEHLHAIALREYLMVTREIDPDANERVRMEHVQKGYRADRYSQVETLVFMAFYERACAEYCRNLADQIEEPVLKGLIGRIAGDEERHEGFFANLIAHCLDYVHDETLAAIAARAAELKIVGADIDAYADRQPGIAEAGIFGPDQLRRVISDRISAWGLAAHPDLKQFVIG
ncbi:acyl-ACP desaturase [Mycolicibacter hiberniae]|uniref:Putative acyl-[acyl-carrier-protein] desaturase DesA2 n=1 Tax=Mycolicibacter hiberniae TaxID=29314 RepID=A0A7I7X008_9MYCO|nr:acyl-ACP desaturase [Mycolicibacter hiberniae]MCV7086600.1 acyl-ACP desaturase [Mycolicibacter hiberniae]ORV72866.1 acyl-ACP desaturase [Mycolicibacter hiberniae]BBZ22181.1 putative acyl-[acyl-carrier-protein] desaturase DesA2 [Mycolicibacter hiberniae]